MRDGRIAAHTKYDPGLVQAIKSLDPRGRWDAEGKAWTFPKDPILANRLVSLLGISRESLPEDVKSILPAPRSARPEITDERIAELREMWPGESTPYRHQLEGLHLLLSNRYYGLFWEMGCGKSAPTSARIALGMRAGDIGRTLIVCPKSAINVWPFELGRHGRIKSQDVVIAHGSKDARKCVYNGKAPIVVINFELARMDAIELMRGRWDCVVVDECHRIKSITAQTSKAVCKISGFSEYRYALSGTPSPNSPIDVCGTLVFLDGGETLGTKYITAIKARYCVMGGFNQHQVVAYQNLDHLESVTAGLSQRITKEQCLDLPPKIYETRTVELSREAKKIYGDIKCEAIARLSSENGEGTLTVANILTESIRLLQVCGGFLPDNEGTVHSFRHNPKMDLLKDIMEDLGNSPAIIWANFVAEVEAIAREIDGSPEWTPEARCVVHHGGLSQKDRTRAVDLFKSGEVQYFISTPQSAREAITMTHCSTVVYYSRGWNLLDWLQSQDRAHRIGQTKPVTIISLVAAGTVDERIQEALEKKKTLQELVLGGSVDIF